MIETRSKDLSAPITVTMTAMKVAGLSCGSTTYHSIRQPFAPSSLAASIWSGATLLSPVR
jgi:hypothetical protein